MVRPGGLFISAILMAMEKLSTWIVNLVCMPIWVISARWNMSGDMPLINLARFIGGTSKMYLFRALYLLLFLSLSGTAFGQVYESTDSDGVPTFSDQPSADSHEVEIQKTNVGDSFDIPKDTSEPVPLSPPEETSTPTTVNVEIHEGDDGGNYHDENRRDKLRDHIIDGPARVKTLPAETRPGQHKSRSTSHR